MNIVDVGSIGGLPIHLAPHATSVLSFDPFDKNNNDNSYQFCLGEKKERRKLYVLKKIECSSFYKPNFEWLKKYLGHIPPKYRIVKEILVECRRLDEILSIEHKYDLLKIDAQGSELGVLQGAGRCLQYFSYIEVESYTMPMYENSPLFDEVEEFLHSLGFYLAGYLKNNKRRKKKVMFSDWLFIKHGADPLAFYKIYGELFDRVGQILAGSTDSIFPL